MQPVELITRCGSENLSNLLSFQKQIILKQSIMKKESFDFRSIKTIEDACKATGTDPESINLPGVPDYVLAFWQLTIIVQAINNDETFPDWSNKSQVKWFPWFFILPSGSGFSGSFAYAGYGNAYVGSPLCFNSEKACDYAVEQFEEIYKRYFIKNKI
jgi:hypothetical protein